MDSYFKAAVCDLDKLLDEFEQNTDECDCYTTPQSPYDSKHRSLSSVLDGLQHASPTPKLQEDANSCTASEETSLASCVGTSEAVLHYSPQNEKNVAGLDLLSTVDGGSTNEVQASSLGRCSVPVCDLVNDTGNLIHSVGAHEDAQKLQPDDFRYGADCLIGFGMPSISAPVWGSSAGCSDISCTQQSDGDSMLQNSGDLKAEELNHLALKSGSYAKGKSSDPYDDKHRTASLKGTEVFDQLEQTARLNTACVSVISQNSNVHSLKDETAGRKLPCEPQDDSACSEVSRETYGGNAMENVDLKDESNIESMPSDLPKSSQLHKNGATLPGSCVLSGSLLQTEDRIEMEMENAKDNVGSEELNSNEILNSVSTSCISVEDVQTSLSCLPLPVSICGSLVVTEEKINPLPQNEVAEVISDILAVHAGKSKTGPSDREFHKKTDLHERQGFLPKISQSFVEKNMGGEKHDTEKIIDYGDSQQIKAIASAFPILEYEAEPYGVGIVSCYDESVSPVVAEFTVEDNVIKSDALVSDAELDDFLYGQSLQSSALKSLDNNLLESDANEANVTNVKKLDFTEVSEEHSQATQEGMSSVSRTPKASLTERKVESPTEESTSHVWDTTESDSEALVSVVHTEGGRPKQLLGLPQRAVGERQLNVPERENQEASSVTPKAPLSRTGVNLDKNSEPAGSGESSSEAGRSQTSERLEPLKIPVVLGQKQPSWVPDSEAPNCMNCQVKFTFTKRRHHCRACGKVFCGGCCNRKCKLQYMEKEARVCIGCYDPIIKAQAFERMMSPTGPIPNSGISSEYSSAIPPSQEAQTSGSSSSPSSSVLLPTSVLKQPGIEGLCSKEQRRVWFADGILPNGEVADTTKLSSGAKRSSQDLSPVNPDLPEMHMVANPEEDDKLSDVNPKPKEEMDVIARIDELCCESSVPSDDGQQAIPRQTEMMHSYKSVTPEPEDFSTPTGAEKASSSSVDWTKNDLPVSPSSYRALCGLENCVSKGVSLLPDGDNLPPLLLAAGEKGKDPVVEEHPSRQQVTLLLAEEGPNPLSFILNANFLVNVKLISYSSEKCWHFSTNGLHGLGQAEIIILLQCLPDEETFPNEIFTFFIDIYKDVMKGRLIRNMENITFTENFLGNKDCGGFLFVSPTFQKLDDLLLPDNPFLCGILIHKLEIPWAKVFPIRLMLRLGAEYGEYPTPVVSFRDRKPLFGEIGHTIMNLLVDLRNYQYTLHTIDNLFVHVEMGRSCIKIPLRRYNEVMKVINSSNEHVISIGASFNTEADSHLVCVQSKDGIYHTQANSATGHPRKVTGASFVVFNGALKTSSGFLAKSSIVEDGLMVQITPETMESLRQALRDKKDFKITCGKMDAGDTKEYVDICWVENDEEKTNKGILSPVDGKSMEGAQSEKVLQGGDFETEGKIMKCTEVYYFQKDHELSSPVPHQFAKEIAIACNTALCPHLKTLKNSGMNKIGLRVSIDSDKVEYLAGSGGQLLPQNYLNELDSALIPVIHGGMSDPTSLPLEMELIFFLIEHLF
ncbi:zinc finger FYVE domain-containing protein 16 [Struthio camelus]|uniref:zinc finger FYVE domain-containing protein 16 n=1 Tax=Struthio camelus TaxID=8801 RepID=UPI003603ED03